MCIRDSIWTMYDCIEAAVLANKKIVILDRPNPIGSWEARGPVLHPQFSTFVGRKAIAQQHGLTMGELALFYDGEFIPAAVGRSAGVQVVQMRNYSRDLTFRETGLQWVIPSPNMPTVDTATVYPGTCMFEGTNLSEGRGSTRPFELIGAPYGDAKWAVALAEEDVPGATFREAYFQPSFSKHAGKVCGGVQVHVTDVRAFDALRCGIAMLVTAKRTYPTAFGWRVQNDNWIDRLTGTTRVRTMVDAGNSVNEIIAAWQPDLADYVAKRAKYLLYTQTRGGGKI